MTEKLNINKEGIFISKDLGELKIIEQIYDDFIFRGDEDTTQIDPEYLDREFRGKEEEALALEVSSGEGVSEGVEDIVVSTSTGLVSTGEYTSEFPSDSPRESGKVNVGFNGVPFYSQFESRWNTIIYGLTTDGRFIESPIPVGTGLKNISIDNQEFQIYVDHNNGKAGWSSIKGGGCGITGISMIINYWSKKGKCKSTSPIKIAKMACNSGARPGNPPKNKASGTHPGGKNGKFAKLLMDNFNVKFEETNNIEAERLLKEGHPVLYNGKNFTGFNINGRKTREYPGHFVVLTGIDTNGRWRVNDSGRPLEGKSDYIAISYFEDVPRGAFWKITPLG